MAKNKNAPSTPASSTRVPRSRTAGANAPLTTDAAGGSTFVPPAPDPQANKDDAITSMNKSIAGLQESYNILAAASAGPPLPPLDVRQELLMEKGDVHDELVDQELLLVELQAADTTVDPPGPATGQDLADALAKLDQMRQSTDQLITLADLASRATNAFTRQRLEVDDRTKTA